MHRRYLWVLAGLLIVGIGAMSPAAAAPPPEGWFSQDIGFPDPEGSADLTDGVWTIKGAGNDIEGGSDNFHYVFQRITGDVTITAHFVSMEIGDYPWTKMGPMIRASEEPEAQNFLIKMTSGVGVRIQGRNDDYPSTFSTFPPVLSLSQPQPVWLRLQRVGQEVAGFYSHDGKIWHSGGPALTLAGLEEEALVGLAVTSHQQGTLATGVFDNVSVEPGASLVSGLRSCSANTGVTISWSSLKGAESYVIYRGPAGETDTTKFVKVNDKEVAGTAFTDTTPDLVPNQRYTYAVVPVVGGTERGWATIAAGQLVPMAPPGFTITSIDEDPEGVIDYDGGCTPPLGAFYDATTGTIIVRGSGEAGFSGDYDQLNFTHTEVEGDFQITVKALTRPVRQGRSTKAGLMIRESLEPGARSVALLLAASQAGLTFEWRDTTDGSADFAAEPLISAVDLVPPLWIRLTRTGAEITAEYSLDGTTWQGGEDYKITLEDLAAKLNAGLAISSRTLSPGRQITEATFQNLTVTKP